MLLLRSSLFLLCGSLRQILRAGEVPGHQLLKSAGCDETPFFLVTLRWLSCPSPQRKPLHEFGLLVIFFCIYYMGSS